MRTAASAALIALLAVAAGCGDDSLVSVDTEVGEVSVESRDDQLCFDAGNKGVFCGGRPSDENPVVWGVSSAGSPASPTYVWGVAAPKVTGFDVVVTGEAPITPELHEIDGGGADGMSVWVIELDSSGDPLAEGAPQVTVDNIETT